MDSARAFFDSMQDRWFDYRRIEAVLLGPCLLDAHTIGTELERQQSGAPAASEAATAALSLFPTGLSDTSMGHGLGFTGETASLASAPASAPSAPADAPDDDDDGPAPDPEEMQQLDDFLGSLL